FEAINTTNVQVRLTIRRIKRNIEFSDGLKGACIARTQRQAVCNDTHLSRYLAKSANGFRKRRVQRRLSTGQQDLPRSPFAETLVQLFKQVVRHLAFSRDLQDLIVLPDR